MPRRLPMSVLITRCKQRVDLENNGHIEDPEWRALISEVYGEAYGIAARGGSRYFESEYTITATGAASYDEPDDHLYSLALDRVVNTTTGERRACREIMLQERAPLIGRTGEAGFWEHADDQIRLYPKPSSGSYVFVYVPQAPDLSDYADADIVDVITPDGEAFVLWGTAVLAHAKGETSAVLALQRQEAARDRLEAWAAERALANPRRQIIDDSPLPGEFVNPAMWRY